MAEEKVIIYCKSCGAKVMIELGKEGLSKPDYCPMCRAVMMIDVQRLPKYTIEVEGSNADEVQRVTSALVENIYMKPTHNQQSPWISGSFYLTVFVVVIVTLLAVAKVLPIIALPIVLLGGILAVSVIGAFQLRQDQQLSQKNFLELMTLTFKYLPWLRKNNDKTAKDK